MLNGMRHPRFYIVSNVSYKLDQAGQIRLTLNLAEAGKSELFNVRVSEGKYDPTQKLVNRVRAVLDTIENVAGTSHGKEKRKSATVKQVVAAQDQYAAKPETTKKMRELINKMMKRDPKFGEDISALVSRDDAIAFLDELETLSNGKPSDEPISHLKSQVDQHVRRKVDTLLKGPDPFQPSKLDELNTHRLMPVAVDDASEYDDLDLPRLVSLGKVMSSMIAPALLRGSDSIDEVQFVYYPFNDRASAAAGMNIASFMFEHARFTDAYQRASHAKGTSDLVLSDVFEFLREQLHDPTQLFYDTGDVKPGGPKDPRTQSKGALAKEKAEGREALSTAADKKIQQDGGSFMPPNIQFDIETVPITKPDSASGGAQVGRRTLLRIHITDKAASPYVGAKELLLSSVEGELASLVDGTSPDIVQKAIELGLVTIGPSGTVRPNVRPNTIKDFVKSVVPSITYGANNSMVIEAGLASITRPEHTSVAILRDFRASPTRPPGASYAGLPMQIHPAKLDATIIGCPIIRTLQQLMWDFGSGTDADNIYGVVKYTHEIGPGTFTTRLDFTPGVGYPTYYSAFSAIQRAVDDLRDTVTKLK